MNCTCPRGQCNCAERHTRGRIHPIHPPVSQEARIIATQELEKAMAERNKEIKRLVKERDELYAAIRLLREAV